MRRLAAAALIAFAQSAAALDLPESWRLPTAAELGAEPLRLGSNTRFPEVQADLDGDGVLDEALLLKRTHVNGEGLLVRLSSTPADQWLVLAAFEWGTFTPR